MWWWIDIWTLNATFLWIYWVFLILQRMSLKTWFELICSTWFELIYSRSLVLLFWNFKIKFGIQTIFLCWNPLIVYLKLLIEKFGFSCFLFMVIAFSVWNAINVGAFSGKTIHFSELLKFIISQEEVVLEKSDQLNMCC